jgi:hypothetical protein
MSGFAGGESATERGMTLDPLLGDAAGAGATSPDVLSGAIALRRLPAEKNIERMIALAVWAFEVLTLAVCGDGS